MLDMQIRSSAVLPSVGSQTLRGWLAAPGAQFERFRDEIASAEAQAETEAVGQIKVADAKWWLERRHKEVWGRPAESRAQAAAIVQVAGPATNTEDPYIHLTAEDWRVASSAFLNQQRTERGEVPLVGGHYGGLDNLVVEDLGPDHPGEDYD